MSTEHRSLEFLLLRSCKDFPSRPCCSIGMTCSLGAISRRAFSFFFFSFTDSRERGREEKREGKIQQCEKNIHQLPLACTLTGDQTCNPGMSPDWKSNPRPFHLQNDARLTEPHWPGQPQCLYFPTLAQSQCSLPSVRRSWFYGHSCSPISMSLKKIFSEFSILLYVLQRRLVKKTKAHVIIRLLRFFFLCFHFLFLSWGSSS